MFTCIQYIHVYNMYIYIYIQYIHTYTHIIRAYIHTYMYIVYVCEYVYVYVQSKTFPTELRRYCDFPFANYTIGAMCFNSFCIRPIGEFTVKP